MGFEINRDNEQRILSYYFHNPDRWIELPQFDDLFLSKPAKAIFSGLKLLYEKQIDKFDIDTLFNNVIETGELTEKQYIIDIYEAFNNFENVDDAINLLKKDRLRYTIDSELLEDIFTLVNLRKAPEIEDFEKSINKVNETISKIKGLDGLLIDSEKAQDLYLINLEERQKQQIYTSLGDRALDKLLIYPARPAEMTTLFGQKGSGKSSYILYLINKIIPLGIPILFISLEDSLEIVQDKIMSMRTNIFFESITTGSFSNKENFEKIQQTSQHLRKYKNFFLVDDPSLCIKDVENLIRKVQDITKQQYVLVIADLLSMFLDFSESMTIPKLDNTMNRYHRIIKKTGCHSINVLQENENRWRNSKRALKVKDLKYYKPTLNDIKGGSVMAERSRVILYIWNYQYIKEAFISDDDIQLDEDLPIEATLPLIDIKVLKNNRGKVGGKLRYLFDGNTFKFTLYKGE